MTRVRVLERGTSEACRRLGSLLADQGADVVVVRTDDGIDPVFDRSKRVTASGAAWRAGADVVLDDRADVTEQGVVHVVVRSLPEGHPGEAGASALHAEAWAGLHHPPVGAPRLPPCPVGAPVAALLGACGTVAALMARDRGEGVQRVDVDSLGASLLAQEMEALLTVSPPSAWVALQWAACPFVADYPAAEGWVYVHLGLPHHLERFVAALARHGMEREALAWRRGLSEATWRDPSQVPTPREARWVRARLARLFAGRPAEAWEALLAPEGLCVVAVRTVGAWRDHPHPRAAGHVVTVEGPEGGPAVGPGPLVRTQASAVGPWRRATGRPWRARAARASAPTGRLPLAGLRVLDASQVIAGPSAGRVLAWLGADVLHLENPRLVAGWADAFHAMLAGGKRSQVLDLGTPAGQARLEGLVGNWRPEVVVHNLAGEAAARLGLAQAAPLTCRVSAWGAEGPWAGRRGWEQTVQAACGMQLDHGGEGPELFPVPLHDLATGLAAAFGTLWALHTEARGTVDASLAMTSLWLQDHAFRGLDRAPAGRRGPSGRQVAGGGWRREGRSWRFRLGAADAVPYLSLKAALHRTPEGWTRHVTPWGEVTAVLPPLRLAATPLRSLPAPGPRLARPPAPTLRRKLRWARRSVRWGVEVARLRAPWA